MVSASEVEAKADMVDVEPGYDSELEIRPRGLIKQLLPRTMFGRSLLIVRYESWCVEMIDVNVVKLCFRSGHRNVHSD